jgi:hypothetical protein
MRWCVDLVRDPADILAEVEVNLNINGGDFDNGQPPSGCAFDNGEIVNLKS